MLQLWAMMVPYRPAPLILDLGNAFYDEVESAAFPACTERFFNHAWAARVGLADLDAARRAAHFCRFEPLPSNIPKAVALRYHGHQFRVYNPDIGDGRGFLFAQIRDDAGRLLDLGTKGSGTTPYSRTADGRLTLKGAIREILATEMLEALGVNTSKTFAVFETGEQLVRGDEPSPTRSAVLTRLSHGHIRIGTFQRLAYYGDKHNIARLGRYCLEHLYTEDAANDDGTNAARLFDLVASKTATLAASYLVAGFVHGVLNSDNIAVSGESFDYGPWRFAPTWDANFTAAYFDHSGLYAFGRQPDAILWNLSQLAGALSLISESAPLASILDSWGERFESALVQAILERLGLRESGRANDRAVAAAVIACLQDGSVEIDRFFFDWRGRKDQGAANYHGDTFRALAGLLGDRTQEFTHVYWADPAPCSMHIGEVEAIWAAIATQDDWEPLYKKVAAIRRMGEAMAEPAAHLADTAQEHA